MKKFFVFLVILVSLTFSVFADEAPFDKVKVSESLILSDAEIQMIVKECTAEYSGMDLHLGVPLLSVDQVGDMSDFKCNFLLALDF